MSLHQSSAPHYHYYVYYRIREDLSSADLSRAVLAMQAALHQETGIAGRLMQRASDDRTWMEIYEHVGNATAFDTALQREAESAGLEHLIEPGSARHIERFIECA